MVPSSVELKIYEGVVSVVSLSTAVTSVSIGAVVSVVVSLSVVVDSFRLSSVHSVTAPMIIAQSW